MTRLPGGFPPTVAIGITGQVMGKMGKFPKYSRGVVFGF
jgi:hypothetical protein